MPSSSGRVGLTKEQRLQPYRQLAARLDALRTQSGWSAAGGVPVLLPQRAAATGAALTLSEP